jgi:hypothetical protein
MPEQSSARRKPNLGNPTLRIGLPGMHADAAMHEPHNALQPAGLPAALGTANGRLLGDGLAAARANASAPDHIDSCILWREKLP